MKPCPACHAGVLFGATEDGHPVLCPVCDGDGYVRDPRVPRDRGVASYRPLR